jgi:hypothetical protein
VGRVKAEQTDSGFEVRGPRRRRRSAPSCRVAMALEAAVEVVPNGGVVFAISTAGNETGSSGSCGRAYGTSCAAPRWM